MEEKNRVAARPHKVVMDDCKKACITGVSDVISFDLKTVLLETCCGMLTIKGENLHVSKLSLENGELHVDGKIEGMVYSDISSMHKKGQSMMGRLFK